MLVLCFNEPSDNETRSCLYGQVSRYSVLTSLTTRITRSFSILDSLKRDGKLQYSFFVI